MIWLRFLFSLHSLVFAASVSCTVKDALNPCAYLKEHSWTQYLYLKDKTYFRNPAYDSTFMSIIYKLDSTPPFILQERRKHLVELVDFAKKAMQESVRNGRPESMLSDTDRNVITRIEHVHFDVNDSLNDHVICNNVISPEAYYSPRDYSFYICKSAMMLPDANLLYIIGHELGHAIDPCNIEFDLYKIKQSNGGETKYQLNAPTISQGSPETEKISGAKIIASALPIDQFPQSRQMKCFVAKNLIQNISNDDVRALALTATRTNFKSSLPDDSAQSQSFEKSFENEINQHPFCFSKNGDGNTITETIADMWGARVLAKYLREHPLDGQLAKTALFANYLDQLCGFNTTKGRANDPHLPSNERLNGIILTNPDIQAELNCRPVASYPTCDPRTQAVSVPYEKADSTQ